MVIFRVLLTAICVIVAQASLVDLRIINRCSDTIWPAIYTQSGTGPSQTGFELKAQASENLTVSTDWNGRVWGRTNCTFGSLGSGSCSTGDCGGLLKCSGIGNASTLAEFNLPGGLDQSYYDISLVDGYNLPLAIEVILPTTASSNPRPNTTNPSCQGGLSGFSSSTSFDPYANGELFLNTSSLVPLPFESSVTAEEVSSWCPSDLKHPSWQQNSKYFNPCISPCARYNVGIYCCTGKFDSAKKCHANYYAQQAKRVCPDAYSFAFDDQSSTFTAPLQSGFQVIFCPGGRSTMIKKTLSGSAQRGSTMNPWVMVLSMTFVTIVFLSN